jgi:hypothetical protein
MAENFCEFHQPSRQTPTKQLKVGDHHCLLQISQSLFANIPNVYAIYSDLMRA